jgi:hypothetical protein
MDLALQLKIIPLFKEGCLKLKKGFFEWRPLSIDRKVKPCHRHFIFFITLDPNPYKSKFLSPHYFSRQLGVLDFEVGLGPSVLDPNNNI